MKRLDEPCFLHPPLEGEGRLALSEARCETGWGDLSTRTLFAMRDRHPTPPLISFASTLPLQGRVKKVECAPLHNDVAVGGGGGGECDGSGGGDRSTRRGSRQAPALRPAIIQ
jgi:hypothetical protein